MCQNNPVKSVKITWKTKMLDIFDHPASIRGLRRYVVRSLTLDAKCPWSRDRNPNLFQMALPLYVNVYWTWWADGMWHCSLRHQWMNVRVNAAWCCKVLWGAISIQYIYHLIYICFPLAGLDGMCVFEHFFWWSFMMAAVKWWRPILGECSFRSRLEVYLVFVLELLHRTELQQTHVDQLL